MGLLRILVVSQDASLAESLRTSLASHADWSICGRASGSQQATQRAKELQPDVVLLDLANVRGDANLYPFHAIRDAAPQSELLAFTEDDVAIACEKVAAVGAHGYVIKSDLHSRLVPALKGIEQRRSKDGENSQRLQVALRAAKLGTWQLDLAMSQLTSSSQCKANFGRPPDDPFPFENLKASIHPEDRERVTAAIHQSIATVSDYSAEYRCIWPDNSVHWVLDTGTAIAGPNGLAARMMGVSQDITDRKRTEQTLRETEQRLEATLAASDVGTWAWDLPTGNVVADRNLARMFSITDEQAASSPFQSYLRAIHRDDRARVEAVVCNGIKNPQGPYEADFRIVRPDGSVRWVTGRAKIELDAQGRAIRFPGILIDITARKKAEEREHHLMADAVATTAKFRAVFDQTSVFAGIIDLDGIVLEVNRLALDACGYTASDVIGKVFHRGPWWRGSNKVQEQIREATEAAARGESIRATLPYMWADGTERLVDFVMYPILDENGQILFLHPTGVDITDVKRTEENYRRLTESLDAEVRHRTLELEERNAQIVKQSELLQHLSQRLMKVQDEERRRIARELHDSAGQLLSGLKMSLGAIVRATKSSSPEVVEEVGESHKIIEQLTQEIRTMSYLLHPPLLDEIGLSAALAWYIRGLSERSGLEISLSAPEDYERLPLEIELVLFRLIQEALTNIHRHSGSKTAAIRISVDAEEVVVEIEDHGCGISPARLSAIQSQGSGVGIQGMRERIRQLHGHLNITSNESGTLIRVSLPIPTSADDTADESPDVPAPLHKSQSAD
jgi:PAS domain S-box-containing protein